jgi:hypothetical protein
VIPEDAARKAPQHPGTKKSGGDPLSGVTSIHRNASIF